MGEGKRKLLAGWVKTKLGEILEFKYGKSLPAKNRDDKGYRVYGSNGEIGRHSVPLTDGPTLIVGRKGSIGESHLSNEKCWPIDTTYFIDNFHEQPPEFWLYRIKTLRLVDLDRATALPGLNRNDIYNLSINLPPLLEQKRIVAKIEELQARSRRVRVTLETISDLLEQLRQSILAAAFRGDLTRKWREKHKGKIEPATELLKRIRAERRKRWEESELEKLKAKGLTGKKLNEVFSKRRKQYKEPAPADTTDLPKLPEGWCWANWDELTIFITSGSRGWAAFYSEDGPAFVRAQDIKTDELSISKVARVTLLSGTEGQRTRLQTEDLLVTITGANVTKAARVIDDIGEAYVSQHVALARPVEKAVSALLHLWATSAEGGRGFLLESAYGGGKPGLNLDNLRSLPMPLPPSKEFEQIVSVVEDIKDKVRILEEQTQTAENELESLNQSILAKAFRGELVAQDPNDEPASALLKRIREEKTQMTAKRKTKPQKKGKKMKRKKEPQRDILSILRESTRAMTPEDVFVTGGFDESSVDEFYEQLRNAVAGKKIREIRNVEWIKLKAIKS